MWHVPSFVSIGVLLLAALTNAAPCDPAEGATCDSTQGDMLLQASSQHIPEASKVNTATLVESEKPHLVHLLGRVTEAISSGVTPEVKETIVKLVKLIEDDMEENIRKDHLETQNEIDSDTKDYEDTTNTAVAHHVKAKSADVDWITCVKSERALKDASDAALEVLGTTREDAESKCQTSGQNQIYSATVPDNLATLTCDFSQGDCKTTYGDFKTGLKNWHDGLSGAISVKKSEYTEAKTICDESEGRKREQQEAANDGTLAWEEERVRCERLQTLREVAMCVFGEKLQDKCKAKDDYEKLIRDVDTRHGGVYSEVDRKSEWDSIQVMKCMLVKHKDGEEFDAATMSACQSNAAYDAEVGTLDKKAGPFEASTSAEKFTCFEATITFNGTTCTRPAGASDYTCDIAYAPAFNKAKSSASFDFCAIDAGTCDGFTCPTGTTSKAAESVCFLNKGCTVTECCDGTPSPVKLSLTEILMKVPKTDLHMHIEGSLEPEMAFRLANKYNMLPLQVPKATGGFTEVATLEQLREVYKFEDLLSFLNIYNLLATTMREAEDFEGLAYDYVKNAAAQGTLYNEVFFDPQTHTSRGLDFKMVTDALLAGLTRAEKDFGVRAEMLCSILRDNPVGAESDVGPDVDPLHMVLDKTTATAWATVKQCVAYNQQTDPGPGGKKLLAMAMDNAEVGHFGSAIEWEGVWGFPPHLFKDVYAYAVERGFMATAHAGEEGPPAYVWDALNTLKVNRIDHGVRTLEDPELIKHIKSNKIPLTVCPRSNLKLKVYPEPAQMTLLSMLDQGLLASANSDDPSYFGGYAGDQFTFIVEACAGSGGCGPEGNRRRLTAEDIRTIALNGFKSTLHLTDDEANAYLAQVNTFMDKHKVSLEKYLAEYQVECFSTGARYSPDMAGGERSVEASAEACQGRCSRTAGCAFFSHWSDGGCHLQGAGASRTAEADVISGPASCQA